MLKTFNCGIGMILIMKKNDIEEIYEFSKKIKQPVKISGKITDKRKITFI